jgi:8-oxo-dGTP pyrophosphatase MutT (NUDIX family)
MNVTLSAGAVLVRRRNGAWQYLLLRAYGHWDFPKGTVEPGEDHGTAALREIAEETGLMDVSPSWGSDFVETEPYGKGKIARYYLLEVAAGEIELRPNPVSGIIEHHEHRWLPYAEARTLLVPRVAAVLDWAQRQITA